MSGNDDDKPSGHEDRTIFSPVTGVVPGAPVTAPPVPDPAPAVTQAPFPLHAQMAGGPRRIQVGDVLNHIFEVRRFIAKGGMGEVFEGVNINSDERVAIKGILPHLAADPAVQEMFRKEARTLTRLSHPALVQYRVLAQEPQIGAFYIVTEFIDGQNMSDLLPRVEASPAQLSMLIKRLAEGLAAAHQLGAIHRDISPDNVMLEDGRLDRAKIIDFGIAKDLAPGSATIVGDGFAGKLNYVAPEQLGDFGREIGPWTDVYSLGLTILAVARQKDVDMGGSFVDAVDKRRQGPDLTPIPEVLRPVLAKMLAPDPANRVRSMEEVVQLVAAPSAAPPVTAAPPASPRQPPKPKVAPPAGSAAATPAWRMPAIAGGAVLAVLVLVMVGWHFASGGKSAPAAGPPTPAASAPTDPIVAARAAVTAGLASIPCSWLDLGNADASGGNVSLSFSGVAGKPAEAQAAITRLLSAKGLQAGSIDFTNVSPLDARDCGAMEAFSKIRAPGVQHMRAPQRRYTMATLGPTAGADAGKLGAQPVVDFDLNGVPDDLSVIGLEPDGAMTQISNSRNSPGFKDPQAFAPQTPGVFRLTLNVTHPGTSGILMLTGKAPFDPALLNSPNGSPGADWPAKFLAAAQQNGWQAEMVWFQTVAPGQN